MSAGREPGFPGAPSRVHLIGIGGVGMAGLAQLLHQAGHRVSGTDASDSRLIRELRDIGICIHLGHARGTLPAEVDWAIRTPAVRGDNPEVEGLRSRGVPVYARGEVLAGVANRRRTLAVAGAHGKTTTSAMLLHILRRNGIRAGYAIGGETAFPGRVADTGDPDAPLVVEADESDGTLARYRPAVAVVTHVEWDHVERFSTEDALWACYRRFLASSGTAWVRCGDPAAGLVEGETIRRTVGGDANADLQLLETTSGPQGAVFRFRWRERDLSGRIPLPGGHNVWNALMAIAAAAEEGVDPGDAAASLADFAGVGRRFQMCERNGIVCIQDYAHHPTEVRAVLESVRALRPSRIRVIFQPHRYSRTRHLLAEFAAALAGADDLALLPVYAAFESPDQGADSEALARACRDVHPEARVWTDRRALRDRWLAETRPGEAVLMAGAGDVGGLWDAWVSDTPGESGGGSR